MTDPTIIDKSKLDPNQAAAEADATPVTEKASCPLSAPNLQLIPIRYALVENLKVNVKSDEIKSRPVGYRFIRDGWLYIVDGKDGRLYEHKLKDGVIIERTFKGRWLSADVRSEYDKFPQKDNKELALIFNKDRAIYVSFAEVQWTNKQCNQMSYKKECDMFMQRVDLVGVDCSHQNEHLLTRQKAEKWIAEVAEKPTQPTPEHTFDEEIEPYAWEDKNQSNFNKASIGKLLKQVRSDFQKGNYLFLVVNDYIGMMQDLAQEQEKITQWMGKWAEKKDNNQENHTKYNIATYIESTLEITEQNALTKGANEWIMGLGTPQRQTIFDYAMAKIKVEYNDGIGWMIDPKATLEDLKRDGTQAYTIRTPWYLDLVSDTQKKYRLMINAITQAEYDKHKDEIETLKDTQMNYLYGSIWGNRGLYQLVKIKELKEYLKSERARLIRWQKRLDKITCDRFHLYTNYFQKATWYFDNKDKQQYKQVLTLECNCTGNMLRTDKVIDDMAEFLDEHPHYIFPAFQTNFTASNYTGLISTVKGLLDSKQDVSDLLRGAPTAETKTANMLDADYWRLMSIDDDIDINNLEKARQANLNPAIMKGLEEFLEELKTEQLTPGQQIQVKSNLERITQIFMRLKKRQRSAFLIALKQQQMTLKTADPALITKALTYLEEISDLAEQINKLTKKINKLKRSIKTINKMKQGDWRAERAVHENTIKGFEAEVDNFNNQIAGKELELQRYTSPLREGEVPFSLSTTGLKNDQKAIIALEEEMLKKGFFRGYAAPERGTAFIKSAWLPSLIFVLQFKNLLSTWRDYNDNTKNTGLSHLAASILGTASSGLSLTQAIYVGVTQNAINGLKAATNNSSLTKQLEMKLGRLSLLVGLPAQVFGGIASGFNIYNNHAQWVESMYYGDPRERLAALANYGVNLASLGVSGVGTFSGAKQGVGLIRDIRSINQAFGVTRTASLAGSTKLVLQGARSAVWAARGAAFTRLLSRLVPYTIAITIVQVAAEFAYNYYNLSDTQKWFLKCCWGLEDQGWDLAQHNQHLADVLMLPWLEDHGAVKDDQGQYWRVIRLAIPGQDVSSLVERPLHWAIHWQGIYLADKVDYSVYFKQNTTLIQAAGPMVLEWRLPWQSVKEWDVTSRGQLTVNLFHRNDLSPEHLMSNEIVGLEYKLAFNTWDIVRGIDPKTDQASTNPKVIQAEKHPKTDKSLPPIAIYKGELSYGE